MKNVFIESNHAEGFLMRKVALGEKGCEMFYQQYNLPNII